ncbi:hypothetical protein [Photobacterium leiognathi]|nr:hypothetical protein [Photobacterium leiognathi]
MTCEFSAIVGGNCMYAIPVHERAWGNIGRVLGFFLNHDKPLH